MKTLTSKKAVTHSSKGKLELVKNDVTGKTNGRCDLLPLDQYYCQMVTSSTENMAYYRKHYGNATHNILQGCIDVGLERTGDRIYLSKNYQRRNARGRLLLVRVVDHKNVKSDFCIL